MAYYPDEVVFLAYELIGLTVEQARMLHGGRDRGYLDAPGYLRRPEDDDPGRKAPQRKTGGAQNRPSAAFCTRFEDRAATPTQRRAAVRALRRVTKVEISELGVQGSASRDASSSSLSSSIGGG